MFSLQDELVQKKNLTNMAIFKLTTGTISLPIQQLFKYSGVFQKEYFNIDIINILSNKIQKLQNLHMINDENIIIFFNLLKDEKIKITHDQFCDLCKLSDIFEVEPLQNCLNKYMKKNSKNIDLLINLIYEQNFEQSQDVIIKNSFSSDMEDELSKNINECLKKKNFGKLPIPVIYKIIEKSDLKKISYDSLFDFINQSIKDRYVLFTFLEIQKLSDDRINELFTNYEKDTNSGNNYYQYLPSNLNFFRSLRKKNDELNLLVKKLKAENHTQIQQMMKKNLLLEEKIKHIESINSELNIQNDQYQDKINKLERENQRIQIQNDQIIKENDQYQNQINKLKRENQQIHTQYDQIIKENDQYQNQINKLEREIQQISIQYQSKNTELCQYDTNQNNFKFENIYSETKVDSDFFYLKNCIKFIKKNKEKENDKYPNQINKLERENNIIRIQNIQIIGENDKYRNQINKLERDNKIIHIQYDQIIEENNQYRNQLNKLERENQQISIQNQFENTESCQDDTNKSNFNEIEEEKNETENNQAEEEVDQNKPKSVKTKKRRIFKNPKKKKKKQKLIIFNKFNLFFQFSLFLVI